LSEYWRLCIDRLLALEGPGKVEAENTLVRKFRSQYIEGNWRAILNAAKEIISRNNGLGHELRKAILDVISGNRPVSQSRRQELKDLLRSNKPKSIRDLIETYVIEAPYEGKKTKVGYIYIS